MKRWMVMAVVALAVGCGGSGGGDGDGGSVSTAGEWACDPFDVSILHELCDLSLSENDTGQIAGFGTFGPAGIADNMQISGVHSHPSVTMVWSFDAFAPIAYTATFVDRNTISGRIDGSGFENVEVTIRRQ